MSSLCPAFDPTGPFVRGVLGYVDCETTNLAEQGYRLIGAGTQFAQALDALLIVAVALFGYRMLMGQTPALRDGVVLAIKIGFVVALAQHWSAYQPAVYNLATGTPQALVAQLFGESRAINPGSLLIDRVEVVDAALGQILHPERSTRPAPRPSSPVINPTDAANQAGAELAPDTRDTLGSASTTLLLTIVASTAGLRIAMAVLLALGPLFVAALLFTGTGPMFSGWLRALAGTMLGLVCVPIVMAFELALIEPQIAALTRAFAGGAALGNLPDRLWVTTIAFAAALAVVLILVLRAAAGLRFPQWGHTLVEQLAGPSRSSHIDMPPMSDRAVPPAARDHAQRVADAARMAEQRDTPRAETTTRIAITDGMRSIGSGQAAPALAGRAAPGRVSGGRMSAAAQRRDGN